MVRCARAARHSLGQLSDVGDIYTGTRRMFPGSPGTGTSFPTQVLAGSMYRAEAESTGNPPTSWSWSLVTFSKFGPRTSTTWGGCHSRGE